MHSHVTWVVVADAGRSVFYRNDGPGRGLIHVEQVVAPRDPPSRDWGTDRPGRSYESVGGARHAIDPRADPHGQAEERFAQEISRRLAAAGKTARFERLILVAPPRFLGLLRRFLPDDLRGKVVGELAKDLTGAPPERLTEGLGHLLAL
jgi:protein required for attachment to host cells